jgi:hypothetical protein
MSSTASEPEDAVTGEEIKGVVPVSEGSVAGAAPEADTVDDGKKTTRNACSYSISSGFGLQVTA